MDDLPRRHLVVSFCSETRKPCPITQVFWEKLLLWLQAVIFGLNSTGYWVVPNIPTHDTWLSSRMIYLSKFWIFLLACLNRCTIWRGSFLSESTLSKRLVSLTADTPPLWLSIVTWPGWLPTLSPSSTWNAIGVYPQWLKQLSNAPFIMLQTVFSVDLGLFWLPLNIFSLCLLLVLTRLAIRPGVLVSQPKSPG